jgi:hypothetical protein
VGGCLGFAPSFGLSGQQPLRLNFFAEAATAASLRRGTLGWEGVILRFARVQMFYTAKCEHFAVSTFGAQVFG